MSNELQEGIYYSAKPEIGNSFCLISLRAENVTQISEIGRVLGRIWNNQAKLKNGITVDLNVDSRHRKNGNLTVLVAYGSELFKIPGSQKDPPTSFNSNWNFRPPDSGGGGAIADGSSLNYSTKTFTNHLLMDHVIFQLIADNEFYTNRAVVEIWKELHRLEKNRGSTPLRITGFYQGFQRTDHRNWLGFHDGVSNLKSQDRPYVISIDRRYVTPQDLWTLNGTYLAFIRIAINLEKWEDTSVAEQEILVGRDKLSGCPLTSVDKNGNPVKVAGCPVPGTSEIIDPGNEYFREHPPYEFGTQDNILRYSHIGRARPTERVPIWDKKSLRIFRQGFEFLSRSADDSSLVVGLNFVSFQNTPERLFKALTYQGPFLQKPSRSTPLPNLDRFMVVLKAGIFFVPPKIKGEPFPGAGIFFDKKELRNLSSGSW
jgi:deferrochelatase/peroxidase EfeB